MIDEYNEHTCITAGELRDFGVKITENIPDCAWIPKYAFLLTGCDVDVDEVNGVMRGHVEFMVSEPFRWVEANVVVDEVELT